MKIGMYNSTMPAIFHSTVWSISFAIDAGTESEEISIIGLNSALILTTDIVIHSSNAF